MTSGREIQPSDIANALSAISDGFDQNRMSEFFLGSLSLRRPDYPSYVVRDPSSAGLWVVSSRIFHLGMAEYYEGILPNGDQSRLQEHLHQLDRALETDFVAARELAGENLWFYRTPGNSTALELASLVDLRSGAVHSASWTVGHDRAARVTIDIAAGQNLGGML